MASKQNKEYGELAQRIERVTEVPMLLLAFVYVIVFILEYLPGIPRNVHWDADIAEYLIIAVFAAELVVKLAVANNRVAFLRTHWIDILIVVVPFLRPLRFLRLLRLTFILMRWIRGLRQVMGRYRVAHVLTVGLSSVLLSAVLMVIFERRGSGHIKTFSDALWWAIETVTTVGYGDMIPATAEGKAVAAFLMLVGISLFGVLTAGIAAYFVETNSQTENGTEMRKVTERMDQLERRIEKQNRYLAALLEQHNKENAE